MMSARVWTVAALLPMAALASCAHHTARRESAPATGGVVHGEWRIRVTPPRGAQYDELIELQGLPLFREAGGRMVGWWKTLIGNLYEHVTIWEYDDMAAFERAVGFLGADERFARFAAARDPLLDGEDSRFLRLAPGASPPRLPERAEFVVHEIHRVPLERREEYLEFMTARGLRILGRHGFRPAGPWLTEVGRWTEVTYLFPFDSLAERERLIVRFLDHPDSGVYDGRVSALTGEITTRLLVPAPFAR
jgi:hypothetical protein